MALSKLQLSKLLSVYGATLTDKQLEIATMYCDCDCSLAEIADEFGITRQGVRDAVVKAESALIKLEDALHLAELCCNLTIALQSEDTDTLKQIAKQFVSRE